MDSEHCKKMMEIADALRKIADDLNAMSEEGYSGENEERFASSGDVVEGRAVRDIADNSDSVDVGRAIKIITMGL